MSRRMTSDAQLVQDPRRGRVELSEPRRAYCWPTGGGDCQRPQYGADGWPVWLKVAAPREAISAGSREFTPVAGVQRSVKAAGVSVG